MVYMVEKKYINEDMNIELTSYIDSKQNIWSRGKDVAKILGYSKTYNALERHVSCNHKQIICCSLKMGGQQNDTRKIYCTFIYEAGF